MSGITKRFPRVVANDDVSLRLDAGELHALLGENGAGKTTLMHILSGLQRPDSGRIVVRGRAVHLSSPREAARHGIGMVHQHFMLVPGFSILQNVVLGTYSSGAGILLAKNDLREAVGALCRRMGLEIDPEMPTDRLSVSAQQKVEIVKLLYRGADILILDEPTASLAPQEIGSLFKTLQDLAAEGRTIVVVTHKLQEVMDFTSTVTVLRGGRVVGTLPTASTSSSALARLMIGRDRTPDHVRVGEPGGAGLELSGIGVLGDAGLLAVDDLTLRVAEREVVGIAGVDGNGQSELAEALCGLRPITKGEIRIRGERPRSFSPGHLIHDLGIASIPEDRRRYGLLPDMAVSDNVILPLHDQPPFTRWFLLRFRAIIAYARQLAARFDIRPPDPSAIVATLSGGNQQKVVLARELARQPRVLIASQPTSGLDISAVDYVHTKLLEARDAGTSVLLISQDLDELFKLSDRIAVMFRGRIVGEVDPTSRPLDLNRLGLLMTTGKWE